MAEGSRLKVIAACDACGLGFIYVRRIGSLCYCRAGRVFATRRGEHH